jgi:hypothetical protein
MAGPRDRRVPLEIESRFDVSVRPAYRPSEEPPTRFESLLEWSFDHFSWIIVPIVFVLLATLIVAQTLIHFRPTLP